MCTSYTNCTDIMQTNIRIRVPSEPEVERQRAFGARSQGLSSTGTISDDGSGTKTTQQPPQICHAKTDGSAFVNFCAFSRGCVFSKENRRTKKRVHKRCLLSPTATVSALIAGQDVLRIRVKTDSCELKRESCPKRNFRVLSRESGTICGKKCPRQQGERIW